eukprot:TRINITY_DN15422_c0_g1_i10.p4 TRINITY_DN15422_c0_g1~~TRINITY_DN15422_c0_g1_i10.p4  ORF type:complete len:161 (+),score=1.76 TRINITY_DN15422_c0_g1_i10:1201-1683(+)
MAQYQQNVWKRQNMKKSQLYKKCWMIFLVWDQKMNLNSLNYMSAAQANSAVFFTQIEGTNSKLHAKFTNSAYDQQNKNYIRTRVQAYGWDNLACRPKFLSILPCLEQYYQQKLISQLNIFAQFSATTLIFTFYGLQLYDSIKCFLIKKFSFQKTVFARFI